MDIKVTGYGTVRPAATTRRRDGTHATHFADFLSAAQTENAAGTGDVAEMAAPGMLGSLLALQEISEEEKRRERLLKQGRTMLEALETLRARLLMGEIPPQMLAQLETSLAVQKEGISDPRLLTIIEEIELRVAVELAKLEMSIARHSEF